MQYTALSVLVAASVFGCQQWSPPETEPDLGNVKSPLYAQFYSASGNSGTISFPVTAYSNFSRLSYTVHVDTPEPNPLFANSCNFRLTTTAMNGFVQTQSDLLGFYDGDLVSGPVTSGLFVYEHDQANAGDMTVDITCSPGSANAALYSYQTFQD
jgi:hypothetical protein